jgi:hypothetical protein
MVALPDKIVVKLPTAEIEQLRQLGIKEGRELEREELLKWLENKYLKPGIKRGSVEGKAILAVAQGVGEYIRGKS